MLHFHHARRRISAILSLVAWIGVIAAASPVSALAAEAGSVATVAAPELTAQEIEGLQFMGQEEKLAHDLYLALYQMWGLPAFRNIAGSEAQHMQAVAGRLDQYAVTDPAAGLAAGEFSDPTLQSLYDDLLAQAKTSAAEALRVGALVEETDILDLQRFVHTTSQPDILRVYENLLQGSTQHLQAFTSQLERETGAAYEPQVMSVDQYTALAIAPKGQHGRGAGGGTDNAQGQGMGAGRGMGRFAGGFDSQPGTTRCA
jgi:hypothetical protein